MYIINKLTKAEYYGLRSKVRKNIFINSHQALLKKSSFSGEEVVMGGIVVEKEKND